MPRPFAAIAILAAALGAVDRAHAQPLGTFSWQLQPFCNVVTVNLIQQGAVYTVDGFDDQCGAPQRASLVGLATPNPDGTIGLGLHIVTAPGGRGVQVDARVSLPTGSGPWTDSAGNTGTFAFAARTGGSPRPLAAIGASLVNPAEVQLRISGSCSAGQLIQTINQNGTVGCAAGGSGDVTAVLPGVGLTGGGQSGSVSLGLRTAANGGFNFGNVGGLVASIDQQSGGTIPAEGPGRRFLWYAGQDALRAGQVSGTQWDAVNVGRYSVAFGHDTVASGDNSMAMGRSSVASGFHGLAIGNAANALGQSAVALGDRTSAGGDSSVALGFRAVTVPAAHGSFVFADRSSQNPFTSFAPHEFVVRAAGGVGFYTNAATSTGVELAKNGSSWASLSDVNAKENFRDVAGEDVLAKIAAMSIQEWNYKAQDASIRHIGPTAQEFRVGLRPGRFSAAHQHHRRRRRGVGRGEGARGAHRDARPAQPSSRTRTTSFAPEWRGSNNCWTRSEADHASVSISLCALAAFLAFVLPRPSASRSARLPGSCSRSATR